ncbi:MAG TPA: fatty acid cis/trans isomerase [Polyangiaceae bacterium]|nr:fatty acid cis/trans isomerase [Polyangiaceae bacterium]
MTPLLRRARFSSAALALLGCVLALVTACAAQSAATLSMPLRVDYELLDTVPRAPIDYESQVRPILESRCVVCHGCYDAPCQLKLSAFEGIARGGSKEIVYDGSRINAADPTRLFIDALTTAEWRGKGFHPVLAEGADGPYARLDGSVLYRMLRLKQLHPQPLTARLPAGIDIGLDRKASCPTLAEFDDYASKHPDQGMPFALPNLDEHQYQTLVYWLAQGAPRQAPPALDAAVTEQMAKWEQFLNGQSLKEQLFARYLYEHLFLASLHFEGQDARSFFELVRSKTPPGQAIIPIATRRPYGDPGGRFYYRLRPQQGSVVAKTHLPYELSPVRLAWLHDLFVQPDYPVTALPSYEPKLAANPFRTFAALPLRTRYRFLLEDARFFIEGFIKGPVCRGQIALNVIDDRFWIVFFDPDSPLASNSNYVNQLADYLAQPNEMEDNLKLISSYGHYLKLENRYLQARRKAAHLAFPLPLERALGLLWNGGGINPNAALTVYRHSDSASVDQGLVGEPPKTSWILDYPLLERIHYLLVAGFDVYGNVGHQLNTRLHMDVLRMEAEENLLAYLPAKDRKTVHDSWYKGIRKGDADDIESWWMNEELVSGYRTAQPLQELYQQVAARLGPLSKPAIARPCAGQDCDSEARKAAIERADRAIAPLARMHGKMVEFLPDVAFVRVELGGAPEADLAYTLLSDKSYDNVSSMFSEQKPGERRDASGDRQTVLPWLEGSYPEFFFVVPLAEVETFVARYDGIRNRDDYERFTARFGVRRTNPAFWKTADWFNAQALREQPERAGIFDLNRYQDR